MPERSSWFSGVCLCAPGVRRLLGRHRRAANGLRTVPPAAELWNAHQILPLAGHGSREAREPLSVPVLGAGQLLGAHPSSP